MVTMLEKNKIPQRNYNRAADFPLHNVGRDLDAVAIRIAQAQAALEAGYDVNEIVPRRGRPLDEAMYHDGTAHGGPGNYEKSRARPLPSRARGGSPAGRYHGRQGRHECPGVVPRLFSDGDASLAVAVLSAGAGYDGGRGTDIGR